MEASTPTPAAHGDPSRKKRALELGRPAFVAREDGAYHDVEMPKKHRCGYNGVAANPRYRARLHLLTDGGGGTAGNKRELGPDKPVFFAADESGGAYQHAQEVQVRVHGGPGALGLAPHERSRR